MTRKEAIKILNKYDLNFCDIDGNPIPPQDLAEAFDMAIEALEQEPSEDCISRQDVVTEIHKYFVEEIDKTPTGIDEDGDEVYTDMPTVNSLLACNKELSKRIKALSSAEPKRGKWLDYLEEGLKWECSECGSKFTTPWHYCPNCGARMELKK